MTGKQAWLALLAGVAAPAALTDLELRRALGYGHDRRRGSAAATWRAVRGELRDRRVELPPALRA